LEFVEGAEEEIQKLEKDLSAVEAVDVKQMVFE